MQEKPPFYSYLDFFSNVWKRDTPSHAHPLRTLNLSSGTPLLGAKVSDDLTWSRNGSELLDSCWETLSNAQKSTPQWPAWLRLHCFTKIDAKILEQVQQIAARYVYNDYTDLVVMVKESIEDGPYVARLCILYKMRHKLVIIDPSGSRTRGSRGLIQDRINSEVYFNSFFPRTIWEWKELSGNVTVAASLESNY